MVGTLKSGPKRSSRPFTTARPALSVHALHHAGALVVGERTLWQWNRPKTTTTAAVRAENSRIIITVDDVATVVLIDRVPVRLGGTRPYFLCPHCGERSWDLYMHKDHFTCRVCQQLDYPSRHQPLIASL